MADDVDAGDEGEGGDDDFRAMAEAPGFEDQEGAGGPTGDADAELGAAAGCEGLFEGLQVRSGGDPAGEYGFGGGGGLEGAEGGTAEDGKRSGHGKSRAEEKVFAGKSLISRYLR
ncbi:hypothetical protein MAIT1_02205 [Magnetofaba australis IT-1]|uniref:Uncharacterized protein n=1 Tax=Magnetofaba australis IT-1 TaxID=1434232 RepID=A0A1Y2K533_9PROT|nr:hypothetical protein MAIT1_02205 [Magnetofaba australis IT-1]